MNLHDNVRVITLAPPTIADALRMRWLPWSATYKLPVASTATPLVPEKTALVPDPSTKGPLVPLTPPASEVTTARTKSTAKHTNVSRPPHNKCTYTRIIDINASIAATARGTTAHKLDADVHINTKKHAGRKR